MMDKKKTSNDAFSDEQTASTDGCRLPQWYETTSNNHFRFLPGILARYLADTENMICVAEQNYIYRNGVYVKLTKEEAGRIVKEHMLDKEAKITGINDAERQWELLVQRDVGELDAEPLLINLRNGIYDVKEGALREHTPEFLSTIRLPVNYNETADCPRFTKFLNEAMEGNEEQIGLIQEMMGYCLVPGSPAQKCFVLVGAPAAGKSVLLRVLINMVGKENVSSVSWQALNERFKTAELFGKLINVFADLPTKNIDDNGIFKGLVGEDFITVERKHQHPFSFQNRAVLIFSCNSIPVNYGDKSEGFYRKLIIIPFNHIVPEEDRDPDLTDKLSEEADGIFLFALEGLRRLIGNNYRFSTTELNEDALQRYREASNSVLAFAAERCDISMDMNVFTGSQELYDAYAVYCKESGLIGCSLKKFVSQLVTVFELQQSKDSLGKRRGLKGIKLKDDFE